MNADELFHLLYEKCFTGKYKIRWLAFPEMGSSECYYGYYYAEHELYVIRDAMTDQLSFVNAKSPKEAFLKFKQRIEEAQSAGGWTDDYSAEY